MADEWEDAPESTWGSYLGETAQDFARAGVNAATFGMSDRAAAALAAKAGGRSYDEELAKTVGESAAARERSPYASIGGDVAGSVALPGFGAARLAGTATRALGSALPRAAPIAGRAIGYGTTGAAVGAAQGAGNTYTGNPWDYAQNALIGGGIGGVLGAAGGAAFGSRPAVSRAEIPSAAETEAARTGAYRTLENLPAQYTPSSLADRAQLAERALRRGSFYDAPIGEGGSPQLFRAVDQLAAPPTAVNPVTGARTHVSPHDIDQARKLVTGDRIAHLSPSEQRGARMVRRAIDDYLQNPPRGAVVPGTEAAARQASAVSRRAHELHGGFKRQEQMEDLISNAALGAGSTHSGLNLKNKLQQVMASRLMQTGGESKFSKAGFIPEETAALTRFASGGGRLSQALGYADKYLGGGGGLGALGAGAVGGYHAGQYFKDDPTMGTVAGLGTSGLGLGLRLLGNRRATRQINEIRDLVAQRNPLYRERVAAAGTRPGPGSPRTTQKVRDAATLALLNQTMTQPRRLYMDMAADKSEWE